MSSQTPCNYCTLQRMSADATKAGKVIVLRPTLDDLRVGEPAPFLMIGAFVLTLAEAADQIDDPFAYSGKTPARWGQPAASFMALTDRCAC